MTYLDNQEAVDAFFEHHGIKGMHWGVRKNNSGTSDSSSQEKENSNHKKLKTAAIILGSAAAIALVAVGTAYVVKNGGIPAFSSGHVAKGEKAVNDLLNIKSEEPSSVLLATRGKHIGNGFLLKGGLKDPLPEYEKAGFSETPYKIVNEGMHRRYGSAAEKVAVSFKDPKGRTDFAGRIITHEVVLPKQHAEGITNFDQAKSKAWSLIKDTFDPFYEQSLSKDLGSNARIQ